MKLPAIAYTALLLMGLSHVSATPFDSVVETISPEKLLRVFPVVPETWKCVESRGSTDVSVMGVPITTAVRRYELPIEDPPDKPTAETTPEVAPIHPTLRMIAMDLGSRDAEAPPLSPSTDRATLVRGLNGEIRSYSKRILYKGFGVKRLVVQIEARGIDRDDFRKILKDLPLEGLVAIEKLFPSNPIPTESTPAILNEKSVTVLTRKMKSIIVDEMDPSKDRTWESSTVDPIR